MTSAARPYCRDWELHPDSTAEVDYLFEYQGQIYPIEVKSGRGGTLRSMHAILQRYPECPEGLVLYSGPYAKQLERKLRFVPLYYAGSLAGLKGLPDP